jgi:putative oxidoreductase
MRTFLTKLEPTAYALLRALAGFMFSFHGLQKIFGVFATKQPAAWTQLWFGGLIELVCGALVMIGLFTRPAAILASGTMAVAYFQFHVDGNFGGWHWLPIVNKGELAAVYAFVFLLVAARGPGSVSVDRAMSRDG